MEGLYVAIAWLGAILFGLLTIWAVTTKAPWRAIRNTALYMAFGLGATFAYFVLATQIYDPVALMAIFICLCVLSYVVAQVLEQI